MIGLETAITRLSFAEARTSNAEALMAMARHRTEVQQNASDKTATEAQQITQFIDRARQFHRVDKTA